MLSKSLIQFSVDGRGWVPSLLFDLRPNYDAVKVLHSIRQQIWKTQQWPATGALAEIDLGMV